MNCIIKFLGKPDDRKKQKKEKSEKENTQKISTSSDSDKSSTNCDKSEVLLYQLWYVLVPLCLVHRSGCVVHCLCCTCCW